VRLEKADAGRQALSLPGPSSLNLRPSFTHHHPGIANTVDFCPEYG